MLASGTSGASISHCESVKSLEYTLRAGTSMCLLLHLGEWKSSTLRKTRSLGQDYLPDSLLVYAVG